MENKHHTAIAVVNIGKDKVFKYCLKSLEYYCNKYSLALEIINEIKYDIKGSDGYNYLTFEKNQIFELFDKYERILRVDTDILISPLCPNVFEMVPREKVGVVYEDVGSRKTNRRKKIIEAQNALGNIDWTDGYFNSGIIIVSKEHRKLFELTEEDIHTILTSGISDFKEQTFLNYRVHRYGFQVHALDFRFNHTRIFSEPWNGSPNRLDSFITHYAGDQKVKARMMKRDYKKLFVRNPSVNIHL